VNFASANFFLFYILVTVAYWALRGREARKWLLLAASYYFYMSWNVAMSSLMLLSTVIDYVAALAMRSPKPWHRKAALGLSCVGQLGMLAYFKYGNFFIDSFDGLMQSIGIRLSIPELQILLPVGISFYTFQTLSYTIDVYRGHIEPTRNFKDFALFVAFFPQLVAGPIVRAVDYLPQLSIDHRWDWGRFRSGLARIAQGLAKKIVIADSLAFVVDPVYADPASFGAAASWIAVIGFAFQLYTDMAAYSDIAIGSARILGYELMENFNHPFLARTMREFWSRCHISLSSWLRDYLYIFALGGNRKGRFRTYVNLTITMFLGGLWHGAGWTYAIWGLYVGIVLAGEKFLEDRRIAAGATSVIPPGTGRQGARMDRMPMERTFLFHSLGLVLFRSQSFAAAFAMYGNLFGLKSVPAAATIRWSVVGVMTIVVATHLLALLKERTKWDWMSPLVVRAAIVTGCVLGALAFARERADSFIYFQF
jgi:D-alanyl-lipoteichoic acid acyltransferase DltB (MBOAT superfamily)